MKIIVILISQEIIFAKILLLNAYQDHGHSKMVPLKFVENELSKLYEKEPIY